MSSGGDGGDDGGDDDDGDGDDVQLDDGDDGFDFPLREGISPADSCPPESSFLPRRGGCGSSRRTLWSLGFRDEGFREEKEAKGVVGPPNHMAARPGHGPRRPRVWAHPGSSWPLLLASFVILKNRIFGIISFHS